ncbi:FecR family protein, partial [Thermophagus xiamenensis]|uniref:FecR family protein n=1 Tax=Thermophagus xiamenensis TaxID=385682 RepID=UPI000255CDEE
MNQEQEQLFDEYLNGCGGDLPTEKNFVKLFCGEANEISLKKRMRKDWDALSKANIKKDLSPILHKIHYIINLEHEKKLLPKGGIKKVLFWYSKIAAILLLPIIGLMIGWLLIGYSDHLQPSVVEVVVPLGARIKTQLPDGTTAWLNSGSTLSYTIPFKQRKVTLEGEGFFNVRKDSIHPFVVKGKQGAVRVLGTRFNIDMWPDEEVMEGVLGG